MTTQTHNQQCVIQEMPLGKVPGPRAAIILKDPVSSLEASAIAYERDYTWSCPTMWQLFCRWCCNQQPRPTRHCSLQYRLPDSNICTGARIELPAPDVLRGFLREVCSMSYTQMVGPCHKNRPDARTMLVFVTAAWSQDLKEKNELLTGKIPGNLCVVAEHKHLLEKNEQMQSLLEMAEKANTVLQSQLQDFENERSLNATIMCRKDAEIAMLRQENNRLQMACDVDANGRIPEAALRTPTSPLSLRSEPMSPLENVDMDTNLTYEDVANLLCDEDVDWHNELQFPLELQVHPDNVVTMH